MSIVMDDFSSRDVTAAGVKVRIVGAGKGAPVVALAVGFGGSAAHRALAERFRVIALETAEKDAGKVGEAAASLATGDEKVGLLAIGDQAGAALVAAQTLGERANAVVFASPRGLLGASDGPVAPLLRGVLSPKLVMLGYDDKDAPKDAVTQYKKGLSRSNVMLIYAAGADIAADRPQAFADVAGDFLERQDRFRFMTESVAIGT
jgi:pimeloyl-ACP methyl ester carboxylesterase